MSESLKLSGFSDDRLEWLKVALGDMRRTANYFPEATARILLEISALEDAVATEELKRIRAAPVT